MKKIELILSRMNSYNAVSFRNQIIIECNYKLLNNLLFMSHK